MSMQKTWWGEEFLQALTGFIDSARLQRGRSYRSDHRILKFDTQGNIVTATVRGNINPYFGVTKEPKYKVTLSFHVISASSWKEIINNLCQNAGWLSKLMLNEIPKDIDSGFGKHSLLPRTYNDIEATCSCPDYANPCKHIAGIYYRLASMLDTHPMLLFALKGIQADELHNELKKTELGKAFAEHLSTPEDVEMNFDEKLYTPITTSQKQIHIPQDTFWTLKAWDLEALDIEESTSISASLIKKQGDYPEFWDRSNSFINAMESLYQRVRYKNRKALGIM